jgi:anti-repressor protein
MTNDIVPLPVLSIADLSDIDGEPRIRDLRLAEILGYEHPLNIRRLISRNEAKLLKYGVLSTVERTSGPMGGAPTKEYHLNQGQAIRIVTLSETDKADDATKQVIDIFIAYQRGAPVQEDPRYLLSRALQVATTLLAERDAEVAELKPYKGAIQLIEKSEGSQNLTEVAKLFRMKRKDLISWMERHRWIYRRAGHKEWLGYDYHTKNGDLEHVLVEFEGRDGKVHNREQVMVTVQGIAKLAKVFGNPE